MEIWFLSLMFVLGACFGSFLCCQVRRMKSLDNTSNNEKTPKQPKLKETKSHPSRSICLHCKYQLKWYDNIPILSWLFLRGKCRKCHHKIGIAEILSELGLAFAFLSISTTFDFKTSSLLTWAIFIITLVLILFLGFLAIYDGLYGELPNLWLIISIVCAATLLGAKIFLILSESAFTPDLIWKPLTSVAILGGLYLLLYFVSKGKWVGDGDWLLGTAIGLALADPWLSLITLFIANLLACLVMYPFIRLQKDHKIYFGPFMVIAFVITLTFSDFFFYAIGA